MNNKVLIICTSIISILLITIIVLLVKTSNNDQINSVVKDKINTKEVIDENLNNDDKKEVIKEKVVETKEESNKKVIENKVNSKIETQKEVNDNNNVIEDKDKFVINYFNDIEQDVDNNYTDRLLDSIKGKVNTMIGFIWYGEKINDISFNDLKEDTKSLIKDIYFKIDGKIENKFPNYKDILKEKFSNIKSFVIDKYDDIKFNIPIWKEQVKSSKWYNEIIVKSVDDMKDVKDVYKEWYNNKIKKNS